MELDKSCKNCEFNFNGKCAGHDSEVGYGAEINDVDVQRECWSISLNYSINLAKQLPEDERKKYEWDPMSSVNDLIRRIETGSWHKH